MTPVAWPPVSPTSGSTMAWAGGVDHPPAGRSPNRAVTSVTVTGCPLRSTSSTGQPPGPSASGAGAACCGPLAARTASSVPGLRR